MSSRGINGCHSMSQRPGSAELFKGLLHGVQQRKIHVRPVARRCLAVGTVNRRSPLRPEAGRSRGERGGRSSKSSRALRELECKLLKEAYLGDAIGERYMGLIKGDARLRLAERLHPDKVRVTLNSASSG